MKETLTELTFFIKINADMELKYYFRTETDNNTIKYDEV